MIQLAYTTRVYLAAETSKIAILAPSEHKTFGTKFVERYEHFAAFNCFYFLMYVL
jgi:hypothetical protein